MSNSNNRPTGTLLNVAALICILLTGAGCTGAGKAVGTPTVATTEQVCASCHGRDGNSSSPMFPRLVGQQHDYLVNQLKALRDHSRSDRDARTYMWGMAAKLDDKAIDALASAYSTAQPQHDPAPEATLAASNIAGLAASVIGKGLGLEPDNAAAIAAGEAIYTKGSGKADEPPCAACHGDAAQGMDTVPRLAGQHRRYIERQLAAYASGDRANEMMHDIANDLDDSQREAVASYLASR